MIDNEKMYYPYNLIDYIVSSANYYHIPYCILRNYECLPYDLCGHDIDISINKEDIQKFEKILLDIQDKNFVYWFRIIKREFVISYHYIYINNGQYERNQIDVMWGTECRGRTVISSKSMIEKAQIYCNKTYAICIPNKAHEVVDTLFSSLIRGGWYQKRYHQKIKRIILENRAEVANVFTSILGEYGTILLTYIETDNFQQCEKLVPKMRSKITINSLKNNFISTCNNIFKYYLYEIYNRIKYTGTTIAIIGEHSPKKKEFIEMCQSVCYVFYKHDEGTGVKIISIDNKNKYYRIFFEHKIYKKLAKTMALIIDISSNQFNGCMNKCDMVVNFKTNNIEIYSHKKLVFSGEDVNKQKFEEIVLKHIISQNHIKFNYAPFINKI